MQAVMFWGAAAGLVHFVVIAVLYANPITTRLSAELEKAPAVRQWPSQPKYFVTQFFGTQIEIYILTIGFLWFRPKIDLPGVVGALAVGGVLAATRVFPRFWNMWIQTTYPTRLLVIEVINGTLGTLVVALFLQATALR
jgi:hypothetical protein